MLSVLNNNILRLIMIRILLYSLHVALSCGFVSEFASDTNVCVCWCMCCVYVVKGTISFHCPAKASCSNIYAHSKYV